MCEYIYIYIYYYARESNEDDDVFFFSSFVLIIHRVCVRGHVFLLVQSLNIPLLSCGELTAHRKAKARQNFISFSRFPPTNKKKKRGTRKKCIHTKLRARRVVFCKYARRREHGNASFTFYSNHDILLRIVKKQR